MGEFPAMELSMIAKIFLTPARVILGAAMLSATASLPARASEVPYEFQITSRPDDSTVTILLVDTAAHKAVPGAEIFELRWVHGFGKGAPTHEIEAPLRALGNGRFAAAGKAGERLHLKAYIAGDTEVIEGSVVVPDVTY